MKKIYALMLVTLLIMLPIASAYQVTINSNENVDTSSYPKDTWLGRTLDNLFFEVFTSYGIEAGCASTPIEQRTWINLVDYAKTGFPLPLPFTNQFDRTATVEVAPGEQVLINWYRGSPNVENYIDHPEDDRQFMGEVYLEYGRTASEYSMLCDAQAYWDYECYYEIYNCPKPCYTDAQCVGVCDTSILSASDSPFPDGAGVCKSVDEEGNIIRLSHTTDIYYCDAGSKEYLGTAKDGELNFCKDPDQNNYVLRTGEKTGVCTTVEPKECYTSYIGYLQVGDECGADTQCISGHCDKTGFFGTKNVCSPVPWREIKKVSATEEQLDTITVNDALSIACLSDSECVVTDEEKYKADCISIDQLADEDMVPFSSGSFFDNAGKVLKGTLAGVAFGGGAGFLVCIGGLATVIFSSGASSVAVAPLCSAAIGGGIVAGGAAGTVLSLNKEDEIVKQLQKENGDAVGLCVAVEKSEGNILDKLFGWAGFLDITGDEGVDGLIFVLGVIILLGFLGRRRY